MVVPPWLAFFVAALVIAFGLYRFKLAFRPKPAEGQPSFRKKGLFAVNPRRHALFGVIYLLLGVYLVAAGFGYQLILGEGCSTPNDRTAESPN